MQNKYSKLNDLDNWDNFELSSPQSSIFSRKQAILTYKKNLDLYSITKGQEIKSIIYLFKENKKIVGTPLIYSGILFQPQNKQKNCRYLAEKFKLNEIFINEILSSYKNINFNLHFNVEDIRPFLWFNYNETNKPKFEIEVRYTSLLSLLDKSLDNIFRNLDDVKQRDIKKIKKNQKYKINHNFDLELLKNLYFKTMRRNNKGFVDKNFDKMVLFLEKIHQSGNAFQTNLTFENKTIYSNLFTYHNNTACYLFGAGDPDIRDRIGGTYSLWKAIERCHSEKINLIDLEGVNSPQRGSFKLNFGGVIKNYFKIKID